MLTKIQAVLQLVKSFGPMLSKGAACAQKLLASGTPTEKLKRQRAMLICGLFVACSLTGWLAQELYNVNDSVKECRRYRAEVYTLMSLERIRDAEAAHLLASYVRRARSANEAKV